jgi:hypothetical protein
MAVARWQSSSTVSVPSDDRAAPLGEHRIAPNAVELRDALAPVDDPAKSGLTLAAANQSYYPLSKPTG